MAPAELEARKIFSNPAPSQFGLIHILKIHEDKHTKDMVLMFWKRHENCSEYKPTEG